MLLIWFAVVWLQVFLVRKLIIKLVQTCQRLHLTLSKIWFTPITKDALVMSMINKYNKNPWVVFAGLQKGGIQQNRSECWKRKLGEDYQLGLLEMNFSYAHPEGLVAQAPRWHKLGTVIERRKQHPTQTSSNFHYTSHSTLFPSVCLLQTPTLRLGDLQVFDITYNILPIWYNFTPYLCQRPPD